MKPDDTLTRDRRVLARWLEEWSLDHALPPAEEAQLGVAGSCRLAAPFGAPAPQLRCGDIRLMHPVRGGSSAPRPVFVALIEKAAGDRYVVAPFGKFSTPGLPGEWRTGFHAPPVRVLCLWNWREVAEGVLRRSWRAGRMPASKLKQVALVLSVERGNQPPDRLPPGRVGPPVRHPLDPRLIYEAEEAAAFDEEMRAIEDAAAAAEAGMGQNRFADESGDREHLLAAEPEAAHDFGKKPKRNKT